MARIYAERLVSEWLTDVPVRGVWAYIWDIEAQRRHDPRISSLRVTRGEWGHVGSVMEVVTAASDGTPHTLEVELVAVEANRSYTTRYVLPDVETLTTVTTHELNGTTAVRTVADISTRPLNWLERAVVKSQRTSRQLEAEADAGVAKRAVEDFYAGRGQSAAL